MARGRMLNKSVSLSIKFNDLPDDTCRLLATWTIAQLDYCGVFYADPAVVKSMIFPRRTDVTIEQIETYLMAMQSSGLVVLFEAKGQIWQWWPGFADNQVGLRADRESTDFPLPPDEFQQDDGNLPESIPQDDGTLPAEHEPESESQEEIESSTPQPETNGAGAPPRGDDENKLLLKLTPSRRILKAKLDAGVFHPQGRRGPLKFPSVQTAEKFDATAERLNSNLEAAIDTALEQGCTSVVRVVNYIAKWQPKNGGKHGPNQRAGAATGRPGYRVADPPDHAESERIKAEIHSGGARDGPEGAGGVP